jgi:hypothetical protein
MIDKERIKKWEGMKEHEVEWELSDWVDERKKWIDSYDAGKCMTDTNVYYMIEDFYKLIMENKDDKATTVLNFILNSTSDINTIVIEGTAYGIQRLGRHSMTFKENEDA